MLAGILGYSILATGFTGATGPTGVASPARVAVVVGSNFGHARDVPLRFAQDDARRFAQVLRELGGMAAEDLELLLEPTSDTVRAAIARALRRAGDQPGSLLMFYYSGHAGPTALHLGATALPWDELRTRLAGRPHGLRIAVVDACQAGTLTASKGFIQDAPLDGEPARSSRGYAALVAAEAAEAAQESRTLGGSFFTHFLISALRGAADINEDGEVTLTEAYAYATNHTRHATSGWARTVQHPVYHFDITGHGEVVLADLRQADARLIIGQETTGHVAVTERGSSRVIVETEKAGGRRLALALPNGRYIVHLRQDDAVYLAEVALPWGGETQISEAQMHRRSYQAVARKGDLVEVYAHRARAGLSVQSPVLSGMGWSPSLRLAYGIKLDPVEIGLRVDVGSKRFEAVDTSVRTEMFGAAVVVVFERPWNYVDVLSYGYLGGQFWQQKVRKGGRRRSGLGDGGLGIGLRLPVVGALFVEASAELRLYLLNEQDRGFVVRPAVAGTLGLGSMF